MTKTTKTSASNQAPTATLPRQEQAAKPQFAPKLGRDRYGCITLALRHTVTRRTALDERRLRAALYALAGRMELLTGERGEHWAVCLDTLNEWVWVEAASGASEAEKERAHAFIHEMAALLGG